MDEEFEIENEIYYFTFGDFKVSKEDNDSLSTVFDNFDYIDFSSKSQDQNKSVECKETNSILTDKKICPDEKIIQIKENTIKPLLANNNKSTTNGIEHLTKNQNINNFNQNIILNYNFQFSNQHNSANQKINNVNNYIVYGLLFKITGAYLTQNELIFLRKSIFNNVMPIVTRDEQRSKTKNIEQFEKCREKIIPLLHVPQIKAMIQNYIMGRRQDYEKLDILENLYNINNSTNFVKK